MQMMKTMTITKTLTFTKAAVALFVFLFVFVFSAPCQGLDAAREDQLADRIMLFVDEYDLLANKADRQLRLSDANLESGSYTTLLKSQLNSLMGSLQTLDFRWKSFTQTEQADIAESEYLLELMTQAQQFRQTAANAIATQQNICNALCDFIEAERFIRSQDTIYKILYGKAKSLSLEKHLAPQLERVKAEEQSHFEKLKTAHDKAKAAVQLIPQLSKRTEQLDERFYTLKVLSTKIQSMVYRTPIQRAKDYLMGIACLAVILIFINLAVTKLQATKKARKMFKKQQELLKKTNNQDYPTI